MQRALEHLESTDHQAGQFLTFRLENEEYGIPILQVQEIKGWERTTRVPNSPTYVRGVVNLRGLIVPIIDLRLRFNLPEREYDRFTVVIVINLNGRLAGLVVDAVTDVIDLMDDQRCSVPEYEGRGNRDFISGLAQREGGLLILLDMECLVGSEIAEAP